MGFIMCFEMFEENQLSRLKLREWYDSLVAKLRTINTDCAMAISCFKSEPRLNTDIWRCADIHNDFENNILSK